MFASRRLFPAAVLLSGATITSPWSYSDPAKKGVKDQKILIIGGGTGGLGVAAQLKNEGMTDLTIIEPKSTHFYQPLWTLVGAGIRNKADSVKELSDLIPNEVTWVKRSVSTFEPESNHIILSDGTRISYDYLIVATGLQIDWDKIPGLKDALEDSTTNVVSIYDYFYAEKTFHAFARVPRDARMIFTVPTGLIKCAGAPQKIMWLLEDTLRQLGVRETKSIEYHLPGVAMFGIPYYAKQLDELRQAKDVKVFYQRELVSVDAATQTAIFKDLEYGTFIPEKYDFLHVTPPQGPPDCIKNSPLANREGWMEVNRHTLQSTKYPNVFGLGDCTNTPNSKTVAAITAQAPVVVHNLFQAIAGQPLTGYYNGYASCSLIIGHKHALLAEFGYDGKIMETFDPVNGKYPYNVIIGNLNQELQQRFCYWSKEQFFPLVYWQLWVRGWWYGTNGPFKPDVTKREEIVNEKK